MMITGSKELVDDSINNTSLSQSHTKEKKKKKKSPKKETPQGKCNYKTVVGPK